jgi:hypothetical protein
MYWRSPFIRNIVYQTEDMGISFVVPMWSLSNGFITTTDPSVMSSQQVCQMAHS